MNGLTSALRSCDGLLLSHCIGVFLSPISHHIEDFHTSQKGYVSL